VQVKRIAELPSEPNVLRSALIWDNSKCCETWDISKPGLVSGAESRGTQWAANDPLVVWLAVANFPQTFLIAL